MATGPVTDVTQLLAGLGALGALGGSIGAPRLVAIGWATVDLERTVAELGTLDARPTDHDDLLGARALRMDAGPVTLLLLEPSTEGRLAAALARRGEGMVALYVAADGPLDGRALRPTAAGLPGRLLPQPHPWGPFVIELSPIAPRGPSS